MSEEHVIPRWVSKVLRQHRFGIALPRILSAKKYRDRQLQRTIDGKTINLVTKSVCKVCNEGWLEREIETPARELATPLILGHEPTLLDGVAQARLAAWAAKIAMLGRYAHEPSEPVADDWLEYLRDHFAAPPTWYVWTTGYSAERPITYENRDVTLRLPDDPVGSKGILMTIVIGHLALKVFGLRGGVPTNPPSTHLFRIWPPASETVSWPPQYHLDAASLDGFFFMFLDSPENPQAPPLPA